VGEGLGFAPGQVVQEFYFDEDVDNTLRATVEKETGGTIVAWDYEDMVDGVLIWGREEDAFEEDLADVLMDASANLDDSRGHRLRDDAEAGAEVVGPDRPGC
jgi:hypothetical protein